MNGDWMEVTYWKLGDNTVIWRARVPARYSVPVRGDVMDFGKYGRFLVERREWREVVEAVSGESRHVIVWCVDIEQSV